MAHIFTVNLPFPTMSRPATPAPFFRLMRESAPT